MNLERGDVINARFPHASGVRGKKRPVVVVQANVYNKRLRHALVAQLTTTLEASRPRRITLMKKQTLEERVAFLEKKVAELESSLNGGYQKDWRRTFGMFTGDEDMKRVDEEARKIRERDRQKTRRRKAQSE